MGAESRETKEQPGCKQLRIRLKKQTSKQNQAMSWSYLHRRSICRGTSCSVFVEFETHEQKRQKVSPGREDEITLFSWPNLSTHFLILHRRTPSFSDAVLLQAEGTFRGQGEGSWSA